MQTQNRENISGIHVVPTVESKFPGHQHIGFGILQKVKIHCKIWDGEIHLTIHGSLYCWKKCGIVGWENNALAKSAFYREIETWDPLLEKKNCIKAYVADMKEMFGFEYFCL